MEAAMKNVMALVFFFLSALAQGDLIDPVADFYYLADAEGGMVSLLVCYRENDRKLDCPQTVQVAETDLVQFVQDLQMKALDENPASSSAALTALPFYGFGLIARNFPARIAQMGRFSLIFASGVLMSGLILDLLEFLSIQHTTSYSDAYHYLASQIDSGVVGGSGEDNREILEQLTAFLNAHARPVNLDYENWDWVPTAQKYRD